MRTLVAVVLVAFVLAFLASAAVRGLRRVAWSGGPDDVGRTTVQSVVEGLIVLATLIVGVLILVALLD